MAVRHRPAKTKPKFFTFFSYWKENTNLESHCTIIPMVNEITTDNKIPEMICLAFSVLMYLTKSAAVSVSDIPILINAMTTAAPRRLNTIETVVDVGNPRVLKKSKRRMSPIITAMNMNMISSK